MNWKLFALAIVSALGLNAATVILHTNYLTSVCLVMVGTPTIIILASRKYLKCRDLVVGVAFVTFSNVITTGIEKLMIYYDVWSFSNANFRLVGFNFLGEPIEEYVYWWMSAVIVSVTYVCFSRTRRDIIHGINILDYFSAALLAKYATQKIQSHTTEAQSSAVYLENQNVEISGSHYARGKKFPTWVVVASAVTLFAAALYRHFRGSWPALASTVLVFFCIAYPNELYSLHNGLWVYNQNRILGFWFLGVPVEEWFMYTMSPFAGGMLLSLCYKKFYHEVL